MSARNGSRAHSHVYFFYSFDREAGGSVQGFMWVAGIQRCCAQQTDYAIQYSVYLLESRV